MFSARLKTTETNPDTLQFHYSRHESDDFSTEVEGLLDWIQWMVFLVKICG
jgi:hypothetical protein